MGSHGSTYQEVSVKIIPALLAISLAATNAPLRMITMMVDTKSFYLSCIPLASFECSDGSCSFTSPLGLYLSVDPCLSCRDQSILIPLKTSTRFPSLRAQITELLSASAYHMIASDCQLDETVTPRASLPTLGFGQRKYCFVLLGRAVRCPMGSVLAVSASGDPANVTLERGSSCRCCTQEGRTRWTMTIHSVGSTVFEGLFLERRRQFGPQIGANVCKSEGLIAAPRRKERLVSRGRGEEGYYACDVIVVTAGCSNFRIVDHIAADYTVLLSDHIVNGLLMSKRRRRLTSMWGLSPVGEETS